MDFPEEYVLVSVLDPGTPSFVTRETQYLGPKEAAESIDHLSITAPRKLILKGSRELVLRDWKYVHENVWGCHYHLRARKACVRCEYYKLNYDYTRAVRFTFYGLCLLDDFTEKWDKVKASGCWGNEGIIAEAENGGVTNALLFIDRHFKRLFELKADMADPQELGFKMFFDEVFADG